MRYWKLLKFKQGVLVEWKAPLFSWWECFKPKHVFRFFKGIFDTSIRRLRPFFGKCSSLVKKVNAIPGRNLPVLNFAYHLPKPWTDRFAHVNGNNPLFPGILRAGAEYRQKEAVH